MGASPSCYMYTHVYVLFTSNFGDINTRQQNRIEKLSKTLKVKYQVILKTMNFTQEVYSILSDQRFVKRMVYSIF